MYKDGDLYSNCDIVYNMYSNLGIEMFMFLSIKNLFHFACT